jgi:signal transduction histidine kinase
MSDSPRLVVERFLSETATLPSDERLQMLADLAFSLLAEQAKKSAMIGQHEEFLRRLVENIPGGSLNVFDRELRYIAAAGSGLADVELTPRDLIGRTISEVFGDEADRTVRPFYEKAFAGDCVTFDVLVLDRQYSVTAAPLDRDQSRVVTVVAAAHEITHRAIRENALRSSEEGAQRRKDRFLATLAHELRQPLSAIVGALALLRVQRGADPSGSRATLVLERQVEQLRRLVDDLLDASKIEAGKIFLHQEFLDLRSVVSEAMEVVASAAATKTLSLTADAGSEPIIVWGDSARLRQVFSNLLTNAVKFTPAGGAVTVTTRREGALVRARITDSGPGIDSEILPTIFEMFSQANPASGGLGIGLAVARGLVESHGGTLEACNLPTGGGAEFVVTLPAANPTFVQ